jgi:4,4'-diaponeurosporenoate glycosyltransferase
MILLALTLGQWAVGFLVWGRLRGSGKNENAAAEIARQLSVIIPARNEEHNLPALLRSLVAQSLRPQEIIVVDDASTDSTAAITQHHGAQVLSSRPLPDGWRGKTWACHQGAQIAGGKYLLFLDADTWFERDGLMRALSEFPATGRGALSVAPHHCVRAFHEQFSAFFNLIMLGGTGAFTLFGERFIKPGLLGQFLLIDRSSYETVGGHEAVKGRVLENFWLAAKLQAANVPTRCRGGRGVFSFRMYAGGWRDLIEGWTKGFSSGAGRTPIPILLLIIVWLGGIFFVPVGIFTQNAPLPWLALYSLCVAQTGWLLRRTGTFHWLVSAFYPVFVLFFFAVFARSVLRSGKSVNWKGREIRAD